MIKNEGVSDIELEEAKRTFLYFSHLKRFTDINTDYGDFKRALGKEYAATKKKNDLKLCGSQLPFILVKGTYCLGRLYVLNNEMQAILSTLDYVSPSDRY